MKKKSKIGIIGVGNMGRALAWAWKGKKACQLFVYDIDKKKSKGFCARDSAASLIASCDIVVLAIKPQSLAAFLSQTRPAWCKRRPLLVTIAAGIATKYFERRLPQVRVVRLMPNLPAKVGAGVSFLCKGRYAKISDVNKVRKLFSLVGEVVVVREGLMDKATALSGSGPGFIFYIMDCFYKAALAAGFKKDQAKRMVNQTFLGSAKLAAGADQEFASLVKAVASPGGATEAGLRLLRKAKLKNTIARTITAAGQRAGKISRDLNRERR